MCNSTVWLYDLNKTSFTNRSGTISVSRVRTRYCYLNLSTWTSSNCTSPSYACKIWKSKFQFETNSFKLSLRMWLNVNRNISVVVPKLVIQLSHFFVWLFLFVFSAVIVNWILNPTTKLTDGLTELTDWQTYWPTDWLTGWLTQLDSLTHFIL